jgi:hypothetical protein
MTDPDQVTFKVIMFDGEVGYMIIDAHLAEEGEHVWRACARQRQHRDELPRGRIRSIEKTWRPRDRTA